MSYEIQNAAPGDENAIYDLICELAEYEKLRDEVQATPQLLRQYLFEDKKCSALVARIEGEIVGYALFFYSFSTFVGRPGIYLEDLFVQPAHRKQGIGTALIRHLARKALDEGCGRLEWSVLDWNAPSIALYEKLGAKMMSEWKIMRVSEGSLEELAQIERG